MFFDKKLSFLLVPALALTTYACSPQQPNDQQQTGNQQQVSESKSINDPELEKAMAEFTKKSDILLYGGNSEICIQCVEFVQNYTQKTENGYSILTKNKFFYTHTPEDVKENISTMFFEKGKDGKYSANKIVMTLQDQPRTCLWNEEFKGYIEEGVTLKTVYKERKPLNNSSSDAKQAPADKDNSSSDAKPAPNAKDDSNKDQVKNSPATDLKGTEKDTVKSNAKNPAPDKKATKEQKNNKDKNNKK